MTDQPATLLSHEEVRPQSFTGRRRRLTRLQEYRQKLRRRRNRRIALTLASTMAVVSIGITYKAYYNPDFTFQQFVSQDVLDVKGLDNFLEKAAYRMQNVTQKVQTAWDQFALSPSTATDDEANDKKTNQVPDKQKEEIVKAIEESEEEEEEEEEEERTLQEEKEDDVSETMETLQQAPEPMTPIAVEESDKENNKETDTRPVLCNIPLSYVVHGKCRRLASQNPIFNLHGLVQDMMQ